MTCALCNDLVDEREPVSPWLDDSVDPELHATIDEYPDDEAHQSRSEDAKHGEKPSAAQD